MKRHFILLGKAGLIYFSWLFLFLFIGLVIAFESTEKINWFSVFFIVIFLICFLYTLLNSYYTEKFIKLPYQRKKQITGQVETIKQVKTFFVKKIIINKVETILILEIKFKRAK